MSNSSAEAMKVENEVFAFLDELSPFSDSVPRYSPFKYELFEELTSCTSPTLTEMYQRNPFYLAMDLAPAAQTIFEGECLHGSHCKRLRSELCDVTTGLDAKGRNLVMLYDDNEVIEEGEGNFQGQRKKLARETISQYFYMPMEMAAEKLNIGTTLLKKRCRELGISRWPHRKLMSLQTLINHVQDEDEIKVKPKELQRLEQEKKLLEEVPNMKLKEETIKLRQASFKAKYKKRKLT